MENVSEHVQNAQTGSSHACAKSHLGICSPLIHYIVSIDSVSGKRRPRSDCANAQPDLGLRCPHMPEGTFSHGEAHAVNNRVYRGLHYYL